MHVAMFTNSFAPQVTAALRNVRARHGVLARAAKLSAQALTIRNTAYRMAGLYAKVAAMYRMTRQQNTTKSLDLLFKAASLF